MESYFEPTYPTVRAVVVALLSAEPFYRDRFLFLAEMASLLQVVLVCFVFCIGQLTAKPWEKAEDESLERLSKGAEMTDLDLEKELLTRKRNFVGLDFDDEVTADKTMDHLPWSKRFQMGKIPWGKRARMGKLPWGKRSRMGKIPWGKRASMGKLPWGKRSRMGKIPWGKRARMGKLPWGKRSRMGKIPWGKRAHMGKLPWGKRFQMGKIPWGKRARMGKLPWGKRGVWSHDPWGKRHSPSLERKLDS